MSDKLFKDFINNLKAQFERKVNRVCFMEHYDKETEIGVFVFKVAPCDFNRWADRVSANVQKNKCDKCHSCYPGG